MRKILVRIFNLIFLVGAVMSIVSFLTKPLVSLNVEVSIPATTVTQLIPNEPPSKSMVYRDDSSQVNIQDYLTPENLEKEGVTDLVLKLDLNVTPTDYKSYFDLQNNYAMLEEALENFIADFIDYAYDYMNDLLMVVAKILAKEVISDQVKDQIKEYNSDPDSVFATSGCEEKVDMLVDKVLDEFEEGNVPISELAATITDDEECGVKGILTTLQENGVEGFEDLDVDEITPEMIEEAMTEALQSVPGLTEERMKLDENGDPIIGPDGAPVTEIVVTDIATALITILDSATSNNGGSSQHQDPEEENIPVVPEGEEDSGEKPVKVMRDDPVDPTPSKEEELKQKVTEFIKGLIPFDIDNIDYSAGGIMPYILLGVILLGVFPWALFALVTIIRTLRKKKCWTKPWIVFFFGFSQLIFGIGLTLAFKFGTPMIMQLAGSAIPEEYAGLLQGLTVNFKTAAYISSIIYLVMIPVTIVYMVIAHKVKKEFKQHKHDKKLAKKAA